MAKRPRLTVGAMVFKPDQEKILELTILGKKLGSHIGEVIVESQGLKKSVTVVIEVESQQVLFDVKLDIPWAFKKVKPGSELKTQITLLNIGPLRKVDVVNTYIIKNKLGTVIYESSETINVEKQLSFIKSFKIPDTSNAGEYLAALEVKYANSFAVSSDLFEVIKEENIISRISEKPNYKLLLILIIFIILASLFGYLIFRNRTLFN